MQRRKFFQVSTAATCLASTTSWAATETGHIAREYYEWRTYQLSGGEKQARVKEYLEIAALPAWERLGIGPVGVFTETGLSPTSSVHVLLPYASMKVFAGERQGLEQDAAYQLAAADYLGAGQKDPAFDRIESSLMMAFAGMPKISPPLRKPRILELREYQSHSEAKARRKIEMFNNGEIPIFEEVGFENVFFGETLIGSRLPNLKYLLASETMEANQESWGKFRKHPKWVAMKDLPEYAETVSKVIQTFLVPTEFSQV